MHDYKTLIDFGIILLLFILNSYYIQTIIVPRSETAMA